MSREWNGIDNLRLDKYYMVILISSLVFSGVNGGGVLEDSFVHAFMYIVREDK